MNKTALATLVSVVLVASAFAGWEDTGAPNRPAAQTAPRTTAQPQRSQATARQTRPAAQAPAQARTRPAPTRSEQPRRSSAPSSGGHGPSQVRTGILPPDLYSVFLDAHDPTENWYRVRYFAEGDATADYRIVNNKDGISFLDLEAHFDLWQFRNVLEGDVDIGTTPKLTYVIGDGSYYNVMPDFLVAAGLEADWLWRFVNGWSFEAGAAPGIYSDLEAIDIGMFGLPFHGCFYYALDPQLSFKAGLEIRLGWDQVVMPILGVGWQPADNLLLELALPRSIASWKVDGFGLFGQIEWRNTTYNMSGDGKEPDSMTFEDWLVGGGVSFDISPSVRLQAEIGYAFGRSISAEVADGTDDIDLDAAPYVGVMLGAEF